MLLSSGPIIPLGLLAARWYYHDVPEDVNPQQFSFYNNFCALPQGRPTTHPHLKVRSAKELIHFLSHPSALQLLPVCLPPVPPIFSGITGLIPSGGTVFTVY